MNESATQAARGEKGRTIGQILLHQPVAILGAVAMLSFLHGIAALVVGTGPDGTGTWLNPFQAVTRPLWGAYFDPPFERLGPAFPGLVKDYLTAAVIFTGMWFWHGITVLRFRFAAVPFALLYGAAWPFALLLALMTIDWPLVLQLLSREEPIDWGPGLALFRDMFVWLIILIILTSVLA